MLLFAALQTGCTFITEQEFQDRVDADGDGVDVREDCYPEDSGLQDGEWYLDSDSDGFGDPDVRSTDCQAPEGYVAASEGLFDCDDGDAAVNPGADELCDGIDNNCDGAADGDDAVDRPTWYLDSDDDGYGDPESGVVACTGPTDFYVSDTTDGVAFDCDDSDAAVYPGAQERCGAVDYDCDEQTWESGLATVDGGATFTDLQDAIDAAAAESEVAVCPGTWAGNFVIAQSLTLTGASGAGEVTLDGGGAGAVVEIAGGTVQISGVTITNGAGREDSGQLRGGGVVVLPDAALTLSGVEVTGNTADLGGGVYVANASLTLEGDWSVTDNAATSGAGLFVEGGPFLTTGGEISGNIAQESGGGVYLDDVDVIDIDGTLMLGNQAGAGEGAESGLGGALFVYDAALSMSGTVVRDNTAISGAGVAAEGLNEDISLTGVTFEHNVAAGFGGGLLLSTSGGTLANASFSQNEAAEGGGGIFATDTGALVISGVELESNSTDGFGGGALFSNAEVSFVSGQILGNSAGSDGCGVSLEGAEVGFGGGLSLTDGAAVTLDSETTVGQNSACIGGGVHLAGGATLTGGVISKNSAAYGGGFAAADLSGDFQSTISEATIEENEAEGGGGGAVINPLAVQDTTIASNTATRGAGLYLYTLTTREAPAVTFAGGAVISNVAAEQGGGAFLSAGSSLRGTSSNWGSGGSKETNSPEDIFLEDAGLLDEGNSYNLGNNESFECFYEGAGSAAVGLCRGT